MKSHRNAKKSTGAGEGLSRRKFIRNSATALAAALAGREEPELRVAHAVVDGETHTSVVQPGLTRGLRWVFGGGPVS